MSALAVCPRCGRLGVRIRRVNAAWRKVRCTYCYQAQVISDQAWPGDDAAIAALAHTGYPDPPRRPEPPTTPESGGARPPGP